MGEAGLSVETSCRILSAAAASNWKLGILRLLTNTRSSFASWAVQSAQPCRLMDLSLINVYKERLIGKGFAQSVGVGPRSALNGDQRMSVADQLEIVVCRDAAVLAANIADRIVAAAHAAIAQRQRFTL